MDGASRDTDAPLVRRAQQGDHGAFAELVAKYRPRLDRDLFKWVEGAQDREEVVQDALRKAFKGLPKFRGDSTFWTWLYCITQRAAKDRFRANDRRADRCEDPFDNRITVGGDVLGWMGEGASEADDESDAEVEDAFDAPVPCEQWTRAPKAADPASGQIRFDVHGGDIDGRFEFSSQDGSEAGSPAAIPSKEGSPARDGDDFSCADNPVERRSELLISELRLYKAVSETVDDVLTEGFRLDEAAMRRGFSAIDTMRIAAHAGRQLTQSALARLDFALFGGNAPKIDIEGEKAKVDKDQLKRARVCAAPVVEAKARATRLAENRGAEIREWRTKFDTAFDQAKKLDIKAALALAAKMRDQRDALRQALDRAIGKRPPKNASGKFPKENQRHTGRRR